jgi:hypothetical protein
MVRKKYVYILSFVLIYFITGIYLWSIENQVNSESVTIAQILDNYKTKCGGDALGSILSESCCIIRFSHSVIRYPTVSMDMMPGYRAWIM